MLDCVHMIVGLDEVGRGCWAGPLVAGAVLLDDDMPITGLRDSKKLSKRSREHLASKIYAHALAYGIGWVEPAELDAVGLTEAVRMAMRRALEAINEPYTGIIIDGSYNFLREYSMVQTIVKADDIVPAVSAASIIAKVARDAYMAQAALVYPGYGFEKHVGYGTAVHSAALKAQGVSGLHRRSFAPVRAISDAQCYAS